MSIYTESYVYSVEIQRRSAEWLCIHKSADLESMLLYLYRIFNRDMAHNELLRLHKIDTLTRYDTPREKILLQQVNHTHVCIFVLQPCASMPLDMKSNGVYYTIDSPVASNNPTRVSTVWSMIEYRLHQLWK